jgi:micrococcal nuclease
MRFNYRLLINMMLASTVWCSTMLTYPAYGASWFKVRWVVDGDTIILNDGRRVRYIGIDAPETGYKERKAEPFANEARAYNVKLVARKQVRLEFDIDRKDDYGRLLAYVFIKNETFVNRAIIKKGLAYCYPFFPNLKYADLLIQAQRKAMQAEMKIWKAWKALPPQPMIGHQRSMRFYPSACLRKPKKRAHLTVLFPSAWDAFREGFAPYRHCLKYILPP